MREMQNRSSIYSDRQSLGNRCKKKTILIDLNEMRFLFAAFFITLKCALRRLRVPEITLTPLARHLYTYGRSVRGKRNT